MTEVKKKAPRKKWRYVQVKTSASAAFENGKSELESLKEEMEEWKGNMESNSMEHLPKFEEVSECCDNLETIVDELSNIEWPDEFDDDVTYSETFPANKRRGPSRNTRCQNAFAAIEASVAALEAANGEAKSGEADDAVEADTDEDGDVWEFDDVIGEIQGALDNGEPDFPGMF